MATVTCCAAPPSVTLTRPSPSTSSRPATEMCHSRRRLGGVVLLGCVVAVLVVVLLSAAIFDRRAGTVHQLRGAGSWTAVRETRRDIKAGRTQGYLGGDRTWSAAHRRDLDPAGQRRLEDGD